MFCPTFCVPFMYFVQLSFSGLYTLFYHIGNVTGLIPDHCHKVNLGELPWSNG